ncbi:MAG: glycosyltransferase [Bacteroidetes bacterium]|jgi:rSAM/selenodomain-associated transferase 2|nr:glycosyltransferase [Bacteroidota bacterium]
MHLSVIIPTLNEAAQLPRTLQSVVRQDHACEVIVVDGGSTDGTRAVASEAARLLEAPRGRAQQMNAGARAATGAALLFLHADTRLPPRAFAQIRQTLQTPGTEAGAFRLTFDRSSPLLDFYAWCTRWPLPQICFGDRGLFMTRAAFEAVGGFPDQPMFEDLALVCALHRRGGFRFLDMAVTTSARRFSAMGTFKQQLLNAFLWTRYMTGADPQALTRYYRYDGQQ